ncbi:MAG TPA: response regulator [Verrucomicrobiae bacterium]|jgi:two-component system response regulator
MKSDGTILLVEDNPDDVFFMQRAFKATAIENPLQVAVDGQEAIDYLAGAGKFADRNAFPLPCLMLLDLKLPRKTGHEVLKWIRDRPDLATLIVIALTTSRETKDITEAYRLCVNAYLVKPTSPAELANIMTKIRDFWIDLNVVD